MIYNSIYLPYNTRVRKKASRSAWCRNAYYFLRGTSRRKPKRYKSVEEIVKSSAANPWSNPGPHTYPPPWIWAQVRIPCIDLLALYRRAIDIDLYTVLFKSGLPIRTVPNNFCFGTTRFVLLLMPVILFGHFLLFVIVAHRNYPHGYRLGPCPALSI